ncbi:MAG TPA: DUF6328 family protein [Acidimicrobiia bacterium]|nr:DUF6328 family protein [Acidimicrobiia bacterium]
MSRGEEQRGVDDQFRSILEGLRTTLPGVQVLFAFLLVLPLQASFAQIEDLSRFAYYVSFFGSALASVLLIAPSAHQRLRAPITGVQRRSITHLRLTIFLTILGTIAFAISLAAAVFLISTLILRTDAAIAVTVAVAVVIGWSWFYIPLVTFQKT